MPKLPDLASNNAGYLLAGVDERGCQAVAGRAASALDLDSAINELTSP